MTAPFLGNDALVVTAMTPALDVDGNAVLDSFGVAQMQSTPQNVTGGFELDASRETNSNVNRTELTGRAWLPWGTALDATSQITWQGIVFEVDGPPRPWTDLDGNGDHIEVACKHWEG